VVPIQFACRCHLLKFFSHIIKNSLSLHGNVLFKVVGGQKPREIAAEVLAGRGTGEFIESSLDQALGRTSLELRDRHLCQELVYGTIRWQGTLDHLISRKTDGRPQKPMLQAILRLGLYQLFWLDRIPNHAAVSETVEIAKQHGFGAQAGFVNAVLRGCLREREAILKLLEELKTNKPSIGYSHPEWLWRKWEAQFGAAQATQLMAWNNTAPSTYARVNMLQTDAGAILEQWRDEGVEYDFVRRPWLSDNLVFELKKHPPLTRLGSFNQGKFYIQDPSTLLAPQLLGVTPADKVLDLCAAPGGKLTFLAQILRNEGELAGFDPEPARVSLMQENCRRLGVKAQIISQEQLTGKKFQKILLDAPCSNTGVMRRRVDLRWRIQPQEITRLRTTQAGLLNRAADLLAPGGHLVYSTCSLEPEENSQQVREFLASHPQFKLESEQDLLPFRDAVDGAYAARLFRMG
jgi:16S rRNA (cytosine967-C5)-methyltransferase